MDSPRGVLDDIGNELHSEEIIADVIQNGGENQAFVVLLDGEAPPTAMDPEAEDTVTHLNAGSCRLRHISNIFLYCSTPLDLALFITKAKLKTPSQQAKSSYYNEFQGSSSAIYDGRYKRGKSATVAPPIELYHKVFREFGRRVRDENIVLPITILQLTAKLMRAVSIISVKEAPRDSETRDIMREILDTLLIHAPNEDATSSDYISMVQVPLGTATPLQVEVKGEMGTGGSDPSVQGAFSYTRYWIVDQKDVCAFKG